ncbi:MAG TPA: 3-deoxy-7-phosphoheptulonate synthase, partial [Chlamydiales bacterium]|nr:3-deoxy-7-phosphoheptulonate synthase [Chlamydiales bacterium]
YAEQLAALSEKVKSSCYVLMRAYVEKPRTRTGWTGMVYDPHLDGSFDIESGLLETRKLFLKLTDLGIPIATELLHPLTYPYLSDVITWGCIGARTVTSQPHRQLASYASFPVGFKNSVDGNIDSAIDGILCSRKSHAFFGINHEGMVAKLTSEGNPHTHIVLRGSTNGPNYDLASIRKVQAKLDALDLDCRLLVDCSHGNCQKDETRQKEVFFNTLENIADGTVDVMGMMLESYIEKGNQPFLNTHLSPDRSITDPCIDWSETENLLLWAHNRLQKLSTSCQIPS